MEPQQISILSHLQLFPESKSLKKELGFRPVKFISCSLNPTELIYWTGKEKWRLESTGASQLVAVLLS